ncbi:hypothetical protein IR083_01460 [Dysgonomonas sp. GY75]|uniref:hypothetical protein n=1 Tax=Dysgonomonas sp. GY75 TaxID=2780419 RepID=UPI0018844CF4|nr:hypothetical protein [Dysgonomonas sp. GY75]MBF0647483.1 hypothetical protein [Dysgonomonas sp. GY75]
MVKYAKYTIFSLIILSTTTGLVSFVYENAAVKETRRFNADKFRETGYNEDELSLFCDVAFMFENSRIRKWDRDIKVEIKNIGELSQQSIDEVDSVIAILAPLIAPVKMERVTNGGNLHVYRRVPEVVSNKLPQSICLNGMSKVNRRSSYSWSINFAMIYDGCHASSQTLMHEFQHALGLDHPIKLYPYYVTIGRSVIPQFFRSQDEIRNMMKEPFYISKEEKMVIKMLYSSEIRSGLHVETFAQKMGFTDAERKLMIPDVNKRPRIIIYPEEEKKQVGFKD